MELIKSQNVNAGKYFYFLSLGPKRTIVHDALQQMDILQLKFLQFELNYLKYNK